MRLRLLAAVIVVVPTVLVAAPEAQAACAATSSKYISGTVLGMDAYAVNVQISFDVVDKYNRKIDMKGCLQVGGYTKYYLVNRLLKAEGAKDKTGHQVKWKVANLPANASRVYIETYPRSPGNPECPTCAGPETFVKYTRSMRRAVAVNSANVKVRMPLVCAVGGKAGRIAGKIVTPSGAKTNVDTLYMWSEAPDNNYMDPVMGWGRRDVKDNGYYKSIPLASKQKYVMVATKNGVTYTKHHVGVSPCKTTTANFVVAP